MALKRMLKGKLHMATVTEANLKYEGSITIDEDYMDLVGLVTHEFVLISNVHTGDRFETYVIPGPRGSRTFCLNGATARLGQVGDRIIVFSTVYMEEAEISAHKAKIYVFDTENRIVKQLH
jgi:aspartate 1-decarboxylase